MAVFDISPEPVEKYTPYLTAACPEGHVACILRRPYVQSREHESHFEF